MGQYSNRSDVARVLDKLCVDLGFCLTADQYATLESDPPMDAPTFADAVFRAEGLDPEVADSTLYRQVRDLIDDASLWRLRDDGA